MVGKGTRDFGHDVDESRAGGAAGRRSGGAAVAGRDSGKGKLLGEVGTAAGNTALGEKKR